MPEELAEAVALQRLWTLVKSGMGWLYIVRLLRRALGLSCRNDEGAMTWPEVVATVVLPASGGRAHDGL